jgi:acyl-CoA thioester hydrolase
MDTFRFYIPIDIRYADLDPQWHVNNIKFLVFIEQARLEYFLKLGLWDGKSFLNLGNILADTHIAYLSPIVYGQKIRVGVRMSHIGNKSIHLAYKIEDTETGKALATAESVSVAYDYRSQTSCPVPDEWREKMTAYENGIKVR